MNSSRKMGAKALVGAMVVAGATAAAAAQPTTPVYTVSWQDCLTADNRFRGSDGAFRWSVDPGCDIYQQDVYERPMTQAFDLFRGRYGAKEYFQYLDITGVRAGFDSRYLYVAIDLHGRNHLTSDGSRIPVGMMERYGFRMSTNPDGRFGILVVSDQPEVKNRPVTRYGPLGTFVYRDTNGDVGGASDGPTGRSVTKTDNPDEEDGMNGYDTQIVSDGILQGTERRVVWVRLSPTDRTVVELAIDYRSLGFTQDDLRNLQYFDFEAIKGGPKDPQNYLWNDKYTKREAGSPNKGRNGLSEFGTEGLENIYEVDTVRGGPIQGLRGDFDGDGSLSSGEALELMSLIHAGDLEGDLNNDGEANSADILEFVKNQAIAG